MRKILLALTLLILGASPASAEIWVAGPLQPSPYGGHYYYNPSAPPYRGPIAIGVWGWTGEVGYHGRYHRTWR
jgi:hypothetical protein